MRGEQVSEEPAPLFSGEEQNQFGVRVRSIKTKKRLMKIIFSELRRGALLRAPTLLRTFNVKEVSVHV